MHVVVVMSLVLCMLHGCHVRARLCDVVDAACCVVHAHVQEFCPGGSLIDFIQKRERVKLPEKQIQQLFVQIVK